MEKQTIAMLKELVVMIIVTFCVSVYFTKVQFGDELFGFEAYLGAYLGHMSYAFMISLILSLVYYLRKRRFLRIFINSFLISSAISFWLLSNVPA